MRKVIVFNMITADGYFEGMNKDISWHQVDEEVNGFIVKQLKAADTILLGRKTDQMICLFLALRICAAH